MIEPSHEQAQVGNGDFHDVVAVEFADADNELFGLLRIARAPRSDSVAVTGVLFAGEKLICAVSEPELEGCPSDWSEVAAGGARMTVETPLERWQVGLDCGQSGFELDLSAASAPIVLASEDSELGELVGVTEYAQLCDVTGAAIVEGRETKVSATGWRQHVWGAPDRNSLAARRSLYFGSPEAGVALLTARPGDADSHADEVSTGAIVTQGGEPARFDQILLSTVYDGERRPNRAGAELYLPDEEFGRRLSGHAICGTRIDSGRRRHEITFFRWSLDGTPGLGLMQSVEPL